MHFTGYHLWSTKMQYPLILCNYLQNFVRHVFVHPGKYYYEVTCHDQGLCRIGWSTSQAALDLGMLIYSSQSPLCRTAKINTLKHQLNPKLLYFSGTDKYGFGFGGTGKKSNNKQFDSYGEVTINEWLYYLDMKKVVRIIFIKMFSLCCLPSLQEFTMHDTIGCYLDLDKGQISFSKNGAVSIILSLSIMLMKDIQNW